ncbi:MAG: Uma2 family endonuclease [Lachnospiraceae bacterium]|nr:Uma2 family endonuclease [Lachnospiraceae bacterium]
MPLPANRVYTEKDYWNLPDGQRAELIDGTLYDMAPPGYLHQKLVSSLTRIIGNYISANNGSCEVLPAPFAVTLSGNDRTWVEPDSSVICDKDKISDRSCEGAPDWIIEIVSPGTQSIDYGIKLFKYRTAGVREYWIVNPQKKIVNVFCFENENGAGTGLYSFEEPVLVSVFPELSIQISELL